MKIIKDEAGFKEAHDDYVRAVDPPRRGPPRPRAR